MSDADDHAATEEEIAEMVREQHRRKVMEREEAERLEGQLPGRSYSADPPTRHTFPFQSDPPGEFVRTPPPVERVVAPISLPMKYATLHENLKSITDDFVRAATMAEGDRNWQAELATGYLIQARELCLKMIG